MTDRHAAPADTSDRELVITRVFDATPERVFDAFTNPASVGRWWGPRGFTTTTHSMDVRPGGSWHFVMHGPDGTDYGNVIEYTEVVRPERIAYRHRDAEEGEHVTFETTISLVDLGGRTELTFRMVFASQEERDRTVRDYGAIEGARETLARLAEFLDETAASTGA